MKPEPKLELNNVVCFNPEEIDALLQTMIESEPEEGTIAYSIKEKLHDAYNRAQEFNQLCI